MGRVRSATTIDSQRDIDPLAQPKFFDRHAHIAAFKELDIHHFPFIHFPQGRSARLRPFRLGRLGYFSSSVTIFIFCGFFSTSTCAMA